MTAAWYAGLSLLLALNAALAGHNWQQNRGFSAGFAAGAVLLLTLALIRIGGAA